MRLRLRVSKCDDKADYSGGRLFRFAVVDLDRAKDYPVNFVCMLPMQIASDGKGSSVFMRVFGDKSLRVARKLLLEALARENDSEVKGEIERRLKLLEPKLLCEKKCVSCGKLFRGELRKGFKQKFCPDCFKKKFGGRK